MAVLGRKGRKARKVDRNILSSAQMRLQGGDPRRRHGIA
jgi:hypothetical protein